MQAVDQVAALLSSVNVDPTISYKESIINLYQHLKVSFSRTKFGFESGTFIIYF